MLYSWQPFRRQSFAMNRRIDVFWPVLWVCLMAPSLSTANSAADAGLQLRVVEAVTDRYILPNHLPQPASEQALAMRAAPGEFEPGSFVLYAGDAEEGPLRVTATPLRNSEGAPLAGAELDIRIVKRWYQASFGDKGDKSLRYLTPELLVYDDKLVRTEGEDNFVRAANDEYIKTSGAGMNIRRQVIPVEDFPVRDAKTLQPLTIAAGSNRQFWVTLHTPKGSMPGMYSAEIAVQRGDRVVLSLPVSVELLPIALAQPALEVSIYYRGQLDRNLPYGSISAEVKSEAQYLADLRNMKAHGINSPTIYQRYESGLLKRVLQLWEDAGLAPENLYYLGLTVVGNNDGIVPKSLGRNVGDVIKLAQQSGVDQVYFYARDEALGDGLVYQFPFWDAVRDAGGKILAAGWQTNADRPGNFDVTGGNEDIFACLGTLRREEAERWHAKGRKIYSYQNPTGGYEVPETWRRNYGLLLWQKDFDGAIPYAYQDGEGRIWFDFDSRKNRDLAFTYPTVDEPVDTLQWEGFREGVDDLRYLNTLQLALDSASGDAADAARAWLAELKNSVLARADLDAVRAQMVAHILSLQGAPKANWAITQHSVAAAAANGSVRVRWQTDARAPGDVLVQQQGQQRDAQLQKLRSGGAAFSHSVETSSLPQGSVFDYRIVDDSVATPEVTRQLASGRFASSPAMELRDASATPVGDSYRVSANISSDYESGVAIDWQRSLLGWWRFSADDDGDIEDESTWGHTAELQSDARIGAGRFGSGAILDGEGDFVSVSDIEIEENGTATIEGWFRFDRFAMDIQSNLAVFSGLYQHAANNYFYFARTNDYFFVGDRIEQGVWHHIALTWSGDVSTATLYVDGDPVRITVMGSIEEVPAIDGLSIGRSSGILGRILGSAKGLLAGGVDEVRVWDRMLSADEVRAAFSRNRESRVDIDYRFNADRDPVWRVIGANAADQRLPEIEQPLSR